MSESVDFASLHWFPFDVAEWLSSPAVSMMLPEQEGAYLRLLLASWGKGDVEPSLPTDQAQLAQLSRLGARWRKLGHLVIEQFEERNGRLVNAKLAAVWWAQQEKHAIAVKKASAGGKAKAAKRRATSTASSSASSTPQEVLELCSSGAEIRELEGAVEASLLPERGLLPAPPPAGGLAPVGAAPPATGGTTNGDRPSPRAASGIAWPPLAGRAPGAVVPGAEVLSEQERIQRAEDEYFARLRERADRWLALNPDRATELEAEERAALGFRTSGELTPSSRPRSART
jgi:uncharacterized protein YdaU (DUF1376 family)